MSYSISEQFSKTPSFPLGSKQDTAVSLLDELVPTTIDEADNRYFNDAFIDESIRGFSKHRVRLRSHLDEASKMLDDLYVKARESSNYRHENLIDSRKGYETQSDVAGIGDLREPFSNGEADFLLRMKLLRAEEENDVIRDQLSNLQDKALENASDHERTGTLTSMKLQELEQTSAYQQIDKEVIELKLARLEKLVKKLAEEKTKLAEKLMHTEGLLEASKLEAAAAVEENSRLTEDAREAKRKSYSVLTAELNAKNFESDSNEKAVLKLQEKIYIKDEEILTLGSRLLDAEQELRRVNREAVKLQFDIQLKDTQISTLQESNKEAGKVFLLKMQRTEEETRIRFEKENKRKEELIAELREALQTLQGAFETQVEENRRSIDEISNLKAKRAALEEEFELLNDKHTELQMTMIASDKTSELEMYKKKKLQLEKELIDAKQLTERLRRDNFAGELETLNVENAKNLMEISKLRVHLSELSRENMSLKAQEQCYEQFRPNLMRLKGEIAQATATPRDDNLYDAPTIRSSSYRNGSATLEPMSSPKAIESSIQVFHSPYLKNAALNNSSPKAEDNVLLPPSSLSNGNKDAEVSAAMREFLTENSESIPFAIYEQSEGIYTFGDKLYSVLLDDEGLKVMTSKGLVPMCEFVADCSAQALNQTFSLNSEVGTLKRTVAMPATSATNRTLGSTSQSHSLTPAENPSPFYERNELIPPFSTSFPTISLPGEDTAGGGGFLPPPPGDSKPKKILKKKKKGKNKTLSLELRPEDTFLSASGFAGSNQAESADEGVFDVSPSGGKFVGGEEGFQDGHVKNPFMQRSMPSYAPPTVVRKPEVDYNDF